MGMDMARCIIEVQAGLIPGQAMPEMTRRYSVSSNQWAEAGEGAAELLAERVGQAQGYATLLMLSPQRVNWVRVDWIWP